MPPLTSSLEVSGFCPCLREVTIDEYVLWHFAPFHQGPPLGSDRPLPAGRNATGLDSDSTAWLLLSWESPRDGVIQALRPLLSASATTKLMAKNTPPPSHPRESSVQVPVLTWAGGNNSL